MIWQHNLSSYIDLGFFQLKYYSLAYIVGFLFCLYFSFYLLKKDKDSGVGRFKGITKTSLEDLLFISVILVVIGGRLAHVFFYNWDYYSENLLEIFAVWKGGMSFHGGLLGMVGAFLWFWKKYKINPFKISDLAAISIPVGLGLGRVANFINGELWGKPTDGSWGVLFPYDSAQVLRHPTQLYEAFVEGFILFIILFVIFCLINKKNSKIGNGFISGFFCVFYGLGRFVIEFYKPAYGAAGEIGSLGLTTGQVLCIPMVVAGIIFIVMSFKNKK